MGFERRDARARRRGPAGGGIHLHLPLLPQSPASGELPARHGDVHGQTADGAVPGGTPRRVRTPGGGRATGWGVDRTAHGRSDAVRADLRVPYVRDWVNTNR